MTNNETNTIWKVFKGRVNGAKESKVSVIARHADKDEAYIRRGFRVLEAAGFGRLVLGRHGHPTRFEWHRNPKHINPLEG